RRRVGPRARGGLRGPALGCVPALGRPPPRRGARRLRLRRARGGVRDPGRLRAGPPRPPTGAGRVDRRVRMGAGGGRARPPAHRPDPPGAPRTPGRPEGRAEVNGPALLFAVALLLLNGWF